ncbi:MAG: cytidylate kinase family protein [Deltaproteobacteria bacterium]|nr:cytidylate kinase family protein [Deltaproteobacteria bacterium]MBI2534966.1 cytidylate kinase family protein [Deltaproteobacteria bacterium]
MAIIAMSRELGSLGTVIGTAVAKELGYEYIYQEITSTAARDYEVLEEKLVRVVEKAPRMLERLTGDFRRYQAFVQAQVFKAAVKDNVVIVGRWSTLLLREVAHAVRVRVTAPVEVRARRVMEMMQVGVEKALEMVRENDTERGGRMEHLYGVDWTAPHLYDLVLNTEKVSVKAGAELVVNLARKEEYRATTESKRKLDNLALASAIRAELKAHRATRDADVDIQVNNGDIEIMGVVSSEAEKKAVEKVVSTVKSVRKLENHLKVMKYVIR